MVKFSSVEKYLAIAGIFNELEYTLPHVYTPSHLKINLMKRPLKNPWIAQIS